MNSDSQERQVVLITSSGDEWTGTIHPIDPDSDYARFLIVLSALMPRPTTVKNDDGTYSHTLDLTNV